MQKEEPEILLARYLRGESTDEECAAVERWYLNWKPEAFDLSAEELYLDLAEIKNRLPEPKRSGIFRYRFAAAAIVLFTLGTAFYFFSRNEQRHFEQKAVNKHYKIVPGGNKAMLTLASGKTIILDTATIGKLASESGIRITKTANGELVYQAEEMLKSENADTYNTIATPKGGQYQLLLPDGTKVWLNAASSLRFPVIFKGGERKVELSGEAYFEVAKNKNMPFKVNTSNQQIEVLGTHFNVNAYADENITKTTLLEGKVHITKGSTTVLLLPGQQALNSSNSNLLTIKKVPDVLESVSWKNGLFRFDDEDIYTIMNKISRWYDVEIEYTANMKGRTYSGHISRFTDVNEVLATMELTGTVHFKIEGRRMIVMP